MERLYHPVQELVAIRDAFADELYRAQAGEQSSTPFIINHLPKEPLVRDEIPFQVMVIGGTIFRSAIFTQSDGQLVMTDQTESKQPQFPTFESFASFINKHLSLHVNLLAINFAYVLEPTKETGIPDGILLRGSKGNLFDGLVGRKVGDRLTEYLKGNNGGIKVAVANDSICLLLAGLTLSDWQHLAGGIIGTGLNFSIFLEPGVAVNIESGMFNKFPQPPKLAVIDEYSASPGNSLFEKMTTGAHLFRHFNLASSQLYPNLPLITTTEEMDEIQRTDGPRAELARSIFKHSAELVAAQVAGLQKFQNRPLNVIVEGGLFWNAKDYFENVVGTVETLIVGEKPHFISVANSSLIGGAKLLV